MFWLLFQILVVAFESNAIYWNWKQIQNECKQSLKSFRKCKMTSHTNWKRRRTSQKCVHIEDVSEFSLKLIPKQCYRMIWMRKLSQFYKNFNEYNASKISNIFMQGSLVWIFHKSIVYTKMHTTEIYWS